MLIKMNVWRDKVMKTIYARIENYKDIIIAALQSLLLLVLFIFTGPEYSPSGDINIAEFLASTTKDGFYYISPVLSAVLRLFVHWFPGVNWWTIFSIVMMFSGMFILNYLILKIIPVYKYGICVSVSFSAFMWVNMIGVNVNFTQTAEICALSGMILIYCSHIFRKSGKLASIIIGGIYIVIAGEMRIETLLLCVPFVLMGLIYRAIVYVRNNHTGGIKSLVGIKKSVILPAVMVILLVGGMFIIHSSCQKIKPYWGEYVKEYENERKIYDYSDRYPSWQEGQKEYEAAGINQSWFNMLFQYYIVDSNFFKADDMQKLIDYRGDSTETLVSFISSLNDVCLELILIVLIMIGIVAVYGIRRILFPLLGNIAAFLLCGMGFAHMGRYTWQTTSGVIMACVVLFIFMSSEKRSDDNREFIIQLSKSNRTQKIAVLVSTICVIGIATVYTADNKEIKIPSSEITSKKDADLLDYVNKNHENMYLIPNTYYSCNSIWTAKPVDYLDNLFPAQSNFVRGRNSDLLKYGITDQSQFIPYMLTSKNAYSLYDDTFISYLCDYYNPYVSVSIVDTFDETGTEFVRYSIPVQMEKTEDNKASVSDVKMVLDSSREKNNYQVFRISAKVADENYDDYFMNVIDNTTGAVYSYPLVSNGDELSGLAIWRNDTWQFENTSRYIAGRNSDKCIELADISNVPVPAE